MTLSQMKEWQAESVAQALAELESEMMVQYSGFVCVKLTGKGE